jgi:DNA-binding PadR family transcriptional regulator
MTKAKPKKQYASKYAKNYFETNNKIDEKTLKLRAEEFLASGTAASYATQVVLAVAILSRAPVLGAIAPGITVAARGFQRSKHYSNRQIVDATHNLKRGGYIEDEDDEGGGGPPRVRLTKKGEAYFQKILFDDVELPEPKKWGGKWTFVLFDIPVQFSKAREALRWRLKALGFYQYQKSVWVYPHPCEKEILYVTDYFGVGQFVEILSVDHLSKDEELKKFFEM